MGGGTGVYTNICGSVNMLEAQICIKKHFKKKQLHRVGGDVVTQLGGGGVFTF